MTCYDVVLVGATGSAGRAAAYYLDAATRRGTPLRWAIAGRDARTLAEVHRTLSPTVGIVVADSGDEAAVDALVARARVVLTTAGPFALHGEPFARACARRGVDYVDITGEPAYVRRLIDRYHDQASRTGAKIVPFCGFDSVPSDLGALLIVEHFRRRGVETREAKGFFRAAGGFNPGSAASLVELWRRPEDLLAMRDPFLLNADEWRPLPERFADADPLVPAFDRDLGRWVMPFIMGPINTRVVRRSASLAHLLGATYGFEFSYQEYWDPGGAISPVGYFQALFVGTGRDGSKVWAEIADRGDPANEVTAKIACESALALALDRDTLPGGRTRAGVLTPAAALGLRLVSRLQTAGLRIACPRSR